MELVGAVGGFSKKEQGGISNEFEQWLIITASFVRGVS
jgi:hypothetical protein